MYGRDPIFIHYVYDMERARSFYQGVFEVSSTFESPGWSTLDFGSFELALHILTPGHDDEAPLSHAGMNLLVDEIEAMLQRIEESGGKMTVLREPAPNVPVRVAAFVDSEGNGFELRQEVAAGGSGN